MKRRRLLRRLMAGSLNVSFGDMTNLAEGFGFRLSRVRGSHHIFVHLTIPDLINLQEQHGATKTYQVKQFLKLIEQYNLQLEDEE